MAFSGLIIYSGYNILGIQADYKEEAETHKMTIEYKPEEVQYSVYNSEEIEQQDIKNQGDEQQSGEQQGNENQEIASPISIINQSIIDLQAKYANAIGWVFVPNTKIDYPFVWYKNNDYYLHRNINGKAAKAGTIFMDYRCKKDFTSENTIIYGHNMKNDSMFATLKYFNSKKFFDENRYGTIHLANRNLTLEFFAYMLIDPSTEKEIYKVELNDTYFEYVRKNARYYRDLGLTENDRIVTLSTCAYEFNDARMVVLARIK